MKILSFGAGMQSTALALMSCENAFAKTDGKELPYPLVPIYDIVIFLRFGVGAGMGTQAGGFCPQSL